jgi:hypothetical protein
MSITCTLSNHWRYQLGAKAVDIANDTFKAILMTDTFVFDKDTHSTLADVSASELATGNGYTQQNKTFSGGSWTEDDTGDKGVRTFDSISWTASGGAIGPIGSLVIYDDTTSDDTVVGCIDFGTDYTIPEGSTFQVQAPVIEI